jgi:hypothetical protein
MQGHAGKQRNKKEKSTPSNCFMFTKQERKKKTEKENTTAEKRQTRCDLVLPPVTSGLPLFFLEKSLALK